MKPPYSTRQEPVAAEDFAERVLKIKAATTASRTTTRSVTDKRDPFTDGARNLVNGSDAQILAAGPRKSDPYTDGGNEATGPRDPFTDGRHA
ncbi:hypothetical protein [Ralstonia mannitolilytica]|uniref:hypothetical protein n=1 Tax=Ralstonia mannitolilytica TaxID=105219 RepID=UPI002931BF53|nr:hypothetical protein [Ralstonia mannitolilytica]